MNKIGFVQQRIITVDDYRKKEEEQIQSEQNDNDKESE